VDDAQFTRMDDATVEDFEIINRRYLKHVGALPDTVLAMLKALAGDTVGYAVDRYQHSLQTASRALRDGADEEAVVVALLHDVGDIVAPENHAEIGAAILRPYVSDGHYWLLRHHGIFQGYHWWHLVGRDKNAREQYRSHPMFERTAYFCEHWDQNSFDPGYDTLPLDVFEPMVRRLFAREPYAFAT
jgi:predicted HD phosphohydrolase